MQRFVSPYGIRLHKGGHVEVFLAVDVAALGRGKRGVRAAWHIDSGATTSVLPAHDADALGITLKSGKGVGVRTFSGEVMDGYRHLVKIQLGETTLKVPVIFVEKPTVPRVLGREGVFPLLGILFDEGK
jgi:hypothetical protein